MTGEFSSDQHGAIIGDVFEEDYEAPGLIPLGMPAPTYDAPITNDNVKTHLAFNQAKSMLLPWSRDTSVITVFHKLKSLADQGCPAEVMKVAGNVRKIMSDNHAPKTNEVYRWGVP